MLDGLRFVLESFYMKTIIILLMMVAGVRAGEMEDFIGAVYQKRGTWNITSSENALSDKGCIRRVGENYFTPHGVYRKIGNTYTTPDGDSVVTTGSTYLYRGEAVVSTGSTYLGSGKNKVSTGSTVLDSEDSDSE